ncbi:hypothetical protein M413DRAFT_79871 [Hebeloma cylindrosporum]|uniref:Uncharacterized protein n=1 Tax=Hebeloma cylindrosporum TaxID=76867 RepID=A0A0C3BDT8_HEBCY|nr:hypothetical protein M413DRAFT_79871 [Hebeloma cylindrosporum h7]
MNTVNKSMGFSPFHLRMGRVARVIPPLINVACKDVGPEDVRACKIIQDIKTITMEAQDNLLHAKISQAAQANKSCGLNFPFVVEGRIRLSTLN